MMGRAAGVGAVGAQLPVSPPVIFYVPRDDGIEVVRVLHSARDIGAIFDE
jgi:plasmid stabilization system protein ParE